MCTVLTTGRLSISFYCCYCASTDVSCFFILFYNFILFLNKNKIKISHSERCMSVGRGWVWGEGPGVGVGVGGVSLAIRDCLGLCDLFF